MQKSILISTAVSLLFLLVGCTPKETLPNEPATPIIKTIRVATEVPYSPFEWEENGELKGFDMDVIRAIAQTMNWEIDIQKEPFDQVFQKVNEDVYDVGISSITANEKRKEQYGFSQPYFTTYQLIIVRKDMKVASLNELNGKTIAVQEQTTGHTFVQEVLGDKTTTVLTYSDMEQAIEQFVNGNADTMVGDNAFILDYIKRHPIKDYALIRDQQAPLEYLGIVTKKENQTLIDELNKAMTIIQKNGVYDDIYAQYFSN